MTAKSLFVAGVDIGAATAKAVILNETDLISWHVMPTGENVKSAAESVMKQALVRAGLSTNHKMAIFDPRFNTVFHVMIIWVALVYSAEIALSGIIGTIIPDYSAR